MGRQEYGWPEYLVPEKSPLELNFAKRLITPCGGFALLVKLLEKLGVKEHIEQVYSEVETNPNGIGIYAKVSRLGLKALAAGNLK